MTEKRKKKEDTGDADLQTVVVGHEGEAVKVSRPLINVITSITAIMT